MTSELILASASRARARLLASAGLKVRVEPAAVDEWSVKQVFRAETPLAADCALALAETKAAKAAKRYRRAVVIGADQILVCGDEWFDKPADLHEARAQLQRLRGRTHELVTAICVVQARMRLWHTVSGPQLTMRQFSDEFLDDYIATEGAALLGCVG
ncbi:MAG TPA: Maf family protein, partial [Stellaceae bacterium]|nr:Maf family protein [Stellaceae bacterium]